MKTVVTRGIVVFLMVWAMTLSFYLFFKHLETGGPDVCLAVFGNSCNGALSGFYAELLGLPLGGWGILYYVSLGLFFLIPRLFGNAFLQGSRFFIFLFSFCSVMAGGYFIGLMLLQPALFCPFCTMIHGINFLLFFLLMKINSYGFRSFLSSFRAPAVQVQPAAASGLWKAFGFLVAGFFMTSGFFGLKALALSTAARQRIDIKKIVADYDLQPVRQIPVSKEDATAGNPSGAMKLVIFTDFYCPACRMFSAETDSILKKFGGECLIVFKPFPLSTDCNHSIKKDLHAGACEAAKASLAAAQQGKFMEFHHELFKDAGKKDLIMVAKQCSLQLPAFDSFRNGPVAASVVQAGIRQGTTLGIEGTPAVFLNGRQIKDTRPGVVQAVLKRELQATGRDSSIYRKKHPDTGRSVRNAHNRQTR
ncbi:DsbA family protein [Niabella aurantiaca]|uniref:DsbA family protein n=1 Tax=Niabella aurantiaca TaxID=379900 RepID=UPI00039B3840|nr:thioredoxin domain-containing protein [Niabella aurantiaca]